MTAVGDVLLVLVLGSALGWLSQRFNLPNAVAQVVLGVLLGTAVLGWVPHSPALHTVGEIGVVLLLGVAGLELGFDRLRAAGWAGAAVATLGIVFSVGGGYAIGHLYGSPGDEAVYLSLALGATSIGITVQVLEQYGLIGHRVADIVIAAAVIDDVIVLYLLGAAHGFLSEGFSAAEALSFVGLAIAVLGGLFFVSRAITRWASRHGLIAGGWSRGAWILTVVALGASLTHALDLSSVVGAFFAGVGTGGGLADVIRDRSAQSLRPLVLLLMPFFFVMIGVQAQWDVVDEPALRWLLVALILVAIIAKTLGGLLGAVGIDGWRERALIGLGMVARGEVALVIATLGFDQGHITRAVFDALVITTVSVALLGPALMVPFAKHLANPPEAVR